MIDYNEIGNNVEREYRPYLWMTEDCDSHVLFFQRSRNSIELLNIDPASIKTVMDMITYVGIAVLQGAVRRY